LSQYFGSTKNRSIRRRSKDRTGKQKKREGRKTREVLQKIQMSEEVTTPSGLKYTVSETGEGEKVGVNKKVKVHYTGSLTDGTVFDSSVERGVPFEFVVGAGQVIRGWDEALADMRKGEKRTLTIPPELGYGAGGRPPVIPPSSVLIFDVELLDF